METNFNCECGGGLGNLGLPACVTAPGLELRDIFVPTSGTNGRNSIKFADLDASGNLTAAYLLARFNDPDPSTRWTITPDKYEESAPSRSDRQIQESATGTIKVLRNGVRLFANELWNVPPSFAAKINKSSCGEVSVFKVDESGSISGEVSKDGSEFFPFLLEKGSLSAEPFDPTAAKAGYTLISYQLSRLANEGLILTLPSGNIEGDLRLAKSLIGIDLLQAATPSTVTEIFVTAKNVTIGTFGKPHAFVGASLTTDWEVFDSLGAPVALSAVEETADGEYTLTGVFTAGTYTVTFVTSRTDITLDGYTSGSLSVTTV